MPKTKTPAFDSTAIHDRHSVFMEIRRRGMTLSGIAEDAGLHPSACRHGIDMKNRKGAEAIAAALGWPFSYAFPNYPDNRRAHNSEANVSLKKPGKSRQNSTDVVDGRAA